MCFWYKIKLKIVDIPIHNIRKYVTGLVSLLVVLLKLTSKLHTVKVPSKGDRGINHAISSNVGIMQPYMFLLLPIL